MIDSNFLKNRNKYLSNVSRETLEDLNKYSQSVLKKNKQGKVIIKRLFKIIKSNPKKFLTKDQLTKDKFRAISDFISGMTDRYAINLYNNDK